jgi:hypothetical protein
MLKSNASILNQPGVLINKTVPKNKVHNSIFLQYGWIGGVKHYKMSILKGSLHVRIKTPDIAFLINQKTVKQAYFIENAIAGAFTKRKTHM